MNQLLVLAVTSDGLQPTSNGLQPTSDGLQPTSNGLQPDNARLLLGYDAFLHSNVILSRQGWMFEHTVSGVPLCLGSVQVNL